MAKRPGHRVKGAPLGPWTHYLLPLLRPYRAALSGAIVAMVLDAMLTVFRPWPLKVVIDLVLSNRHSRVPLLGGWLEAARPDLGLRTRMLGRLLSSPCCSISSSVRSA